MLETRLDSFDPRNPSRASLGLSVLLASALWGGCGSDDGGGADGGTASTDAQTESGSSATTSGDSDSAGTTSQTSGGDSTGTTTAADESTSGGAEYDVQLAPSDLGTILVDGNGRSLYLFARDLPGPGDTATSRCIDDCVGVWPLFQAEDPELGPGLDAGDFGAIVRDADGEPQATYKGWPLYYYAQDQAAGDVLGEGVNSVWFVLPEPFYTVTTMNGGMEVGNYLADPTGGSLYILTSDTPGTADSDPVSACTGGCVDNWPLFAPAELIAPSLVDSEELSVFERADGQLQATFRGMPLYLFAGDAQPGDIAGHELPGPMGNGEWLLLDPFAG